MPAAKKYELMICSPVADGAAYVRGATQDHCIDCRQAVWVSPSAYVQSLCTPIACVPCALTRARAAGEELEIDPMSNAQLAEMRALGVTTPRADLESLARRELRRLVKKGGN